MFGLAAILTIGLAFVSAFPLALVLIIGIVLSLGCGLANYYNDGIYADAAGFIVSTVIIGGLALLAVFGGGLPALLLGGLIGGTLIGTRFSSICAEA